MTGPHECRVVNWRTSSTVPGVTIPDQAEANSSNSLIIIRGLNVSTTLFRLLALGSAASTVSTYIDDVPLFVNLQLSDISKGTGIERTCGNPCMSMLSAVTNKILHNAPDSKGFSAEVSTEATRPPPTVCPTARTASLIFCWRRPRRFRLAPAMAEIVAGFINALDAAVFGANEQPVLGDPAGNLPQQRFIVSTALG